MLTQSVAASISASLSQTRILPNSLYSEGGSRSLLRAIVSSWLASDILLSNAGSLSTIVTFPSQRDDVPLAISAFSISRQSIPALYTIYAIADPTRPQTIKDT